MPRAPACRAWASVTTSSGPNQRQVCSIVVCPFGRPSLAAASGRFGEAAARAGREKVGTGLSHAPRSNSWKQSRSWTRSRGEGVDMVARDRLDGVEDGAQMRAHGVLGGGRITGADGFGDLAMLAEDH